MMIMMMIGGLGLLSGPSTASTCYVGGTLSIMMLMMMIMMMIMMTMVDGVGLLSQNSDALTCYVGVNSISFKRVTYKSMFYDVT